MDSTILMEQGGDAAAAAAIGGAMMIYYVILLGLSVLMLVAQWRLFTKAGEPGWACLIPIYNGYVMFKIVYGQGWKYFLLLVPVLGSILALAYYIRMAQVYGKGIGFGIANLFFTPITMLILAFGDADYTGPIDSFM